jgi:hypothetical protein
MANAAQGGFWPEGLSNEAATQTRRVRVASNNGTAIFMGDCVARTAAGVWGLATPGSGVAGASMAASFFDAATLVRKEGKFLPASTTYTSTALDVYGETDQSFIYVPRDPIGCTYRCQAKATTTQALADLTLNANFVATAGSTTSGISGHTLGTLATTIGLDFAVDDIKHNVLNDPTAINAKYLVKINFLPIAPGTVGALGV